MKASPEQLELMEHFHDAVTELKKGPFSDHVFTKTIGFTFNFDVAKGQAVEVRGPSKFEVNDMILTLRFVLQANEGISLAQMYALVKTLDDCPERSKFMEIIEASKRFLKAPAMVVFDQTTNPATGKPWMEKKWTNDDLLQHVVYGERAHKNKDKAKAKLVKHMRADQLSSAMLDSSFHAVAGQFLSALFVLQLLNAKLFERETGRKLAVWQRSPPPASSTGP